MALKLCILFCLGVAVIECHPTMYKYNENRILEPDLVPVSSTVIPLPIYQVGYGINVPSSKTDKVKKPEGPIQLVTVYSKKKPVPVPKPKLGDFSTVKQIAKKEHEK